MRISKLFCTALMISLSFAGCKESKQNTPPQKVEQAAPVAVQQVNSFAPDTSQNRLADIIAGKYKPFTADKAYKKASDDMQKEWESLKEKKLTPIRTWMNKNYDGSVKEAKSLYYPFGGPDFSYAFAFYPNVKNYILVGLEPVGSLKDLGNFNLKSSTQFLNDMKQVLFYSIRFGFFRTKDMKKQFNDESGALNVMLFFLKQYNADLGKITLLKWDNGTLKEMDVNDKSKADCVHIDFQIDKVSHNLYYFSQDLSNSGLKKRPYFNEWVSKQGTFCSLVKSASYLMHIDPFFDVRDFLIKNSIFHLQDDSGIKYCDMLKNKKKVTLFGAYTQTISAFSHRGQPDMKKAYESKNILGLPFSIGYNVVFRQTNIQVMQ